MEGLHLHISMNMHFTFLTALFMFITLRRDQEQIYIDVCLFIIFHYFSSQIDIFNLFIIASQK